MTKPDGGPAFPKAVSLDLPKIDGMSLRDYFAGQALTGMAEANGYSPIAYASEAYAIADAMLAEREK